MIAYCQNLHRKCHGTTRKYLFFDEITDSRNATHSWSLDSSKDDDAIQNIEGYDVILLHFARTYGSETSQHEFQQLIEAVMDHMGTGDHSFGMAKNFNR